MLGPVVLCPMWMEQVRGQSVDSSTEFTGLFYRWLHRSKGSQLYEIFIQLLYGQSNDSKARVSAERCFDEQDMFRPMA